MADKRRGHNEGSLYYDESRDRWIAAISLEGGKRKKAYCKTKLEAIRKKNEMLREAGLGILPTGPNQKLKDYLPDWLENVKKETIKIQSYEVYRKQMKYIIEELGEVYLTKLTPEQVKRFENKKLQDGLSPQTVICIHNLLHNALDTAVAWGYIPRNVCELIHPPKTPIRRGKFLTVEQAKQLLAQAKEHGLEVLFTMAIVTGMRRGELLSLKWSSVSFERRVLVVVSTVDYIPRHGFVENAPKTTAGQRPIVLPPFLIDMLSVHKAKQEQRKQEVRAAWKDRNLVFTDRKGDYIYPSMLNRTFHQILIEAGLPALHFHDLRHSTASILLSSGEGVNPKVIQELLGHSNVSMTLGTYAHLLPSMQEKTASIMHDLFRE